ncbi:hypothetical protein N9L68_07500 [bacterium]|nr:hypothetical protein [bacterium]
MTPQHSRAPLRDSPRLASVLNIGSINTVGTPPPLADGSAEDADVVEQLEKQAAAGRGGVVMLKPAGAGSDVCKRRIRGKKHPVEGLASVEPHVMKGKPNKKSKGKGKGNTSIKVRPAAAVQKARPTATVQSVTLKMAKPSVPKNEMGGHLLLQGREDPGEPREARVPRLHPQERHRGQVGEVGPLPEPACRLEGRPLHVCPALR